MAELWSWILKKMSLPSLLFPYLTINHTDMRTGIKILLLLLFPVFSMAQAQQKAVPISPAMFNATDLIYLSPVDGWIFRQGNDTAWARKDMDITGWKKLRPADLSVKYADKNGRVEGWFRIKIKLDKALENHQLGLKWKAWAAADIYVNGKLFTTYGNTGQNGKPFAENPIYPNRWPRGINLKAGAENTIAMHFVDYVSPFPPASLKSAGPTLDYILALSGPAGPALLSDYISKMQIYDGIWVSVCAVLGLLFWLLFIQNPAEKEIRLIAACSTFFSLATYVYSRAFTPTAYFDDLLWNYALGLLTELIIITIPVILANIFKRKISRTFKVLLIGIAVFDLINNFLPSIGFFIWAACNVFLIIVCTYYIVSAWRNLRGAQWCIVAGLLSSVVFFMAFVAYNIIEQGEARVSDLFEYLLTGFLLSFPLSMLGYVAMRFKEIIGEVRQNAQQVVQLSEEKKQEALSRQTILEAEVNRQTAEIRTTLDHLKSTQTQLIQSEKMASLGELTAGIAHEIQNPLNFVNNFSEVSAELVEEMEAELEKGDTKEARAIAADIKQNLEKIRHHGQRADVIVKGMLQHSRASGNTREPTDINKLADEYLRLSYHGLRAKDKSFNAEMATCFDEHLPKIDLVSQDMGRVLLNLFNNAFYAVNLKQKTAGSDYNPQVTVNTLRENGHVIIMVKDNGSGIPEGIKDKIMQPFFTTKPTGDGTGLGLSLSYDIVVKGHQGTLEVDSKEGEFTTFSIQLPILNQ
jgi:two-component system, NtrC family, sensor kinase